jgi:hypothetical protein
MSASPLLRKLSHNKITEQSHDQIYLASQPASILFAALCRRFIRLKIEVDEARAVQAATNATNKEWDRVEQGLSGRPV